MVGKPNPTIVNIIRKQHNISEDELDDFVFIGDNPSTDIALANNAGIHSCLTLTGCVKTMQEAD